MGKYEKLIAKILSAKSDGNIDFEQLRSLLARFSFQERVKGSHHIFFKEGINEIINIQAKNNKAKAYQVKQVRLLITKYKLDIKEDEA